MNLSKNGNPHHYNPLTELNKFFPPDPKVEKTLKEIEKDKADVLGGAIEYYRREAFIDPDTGHLNKNAFNAVLKHIIEERTKDPTLKNEPITVAVLDLNYLKTFNNESFTGCGNVAIKYMTDFVTKRLRENNGGRNHDLFTRMSGGDEFGVVMRNCTPEDAKKRLSEILKEMARVSLIGDNKGNEKCIGINDDGEERVLQVSAALGVSELLDKDISHNTKTATILENTVDTAKQNEEKNKKMSKIYARSVGGIPPFGDRANAEVGVKKYFEDVSAGRINTPIDIKYTPHEKNETNSNKTILEALNEKHHQERLKAFSGQPMKLIIGSKQTKAPEIKTTAPLMQAGASY